MKTKNKWKHGGGGTFLVGNSRWPSDDSFYYKDAAIRTRSTMRAHFNMPASVRSAYELRRRRKGVLRVIVEDQDGNIVATYKGLNP